jgi:hypothetical protein
MFRKHPKIKGYVLIADYPVNTRKIGYFEPYTTGLYSIHFIFLYINKSIYKRKN